MSGNNDDEGSPGGGVPGPPGLFHVMRHYQTPEERAAYEAGLLARWSTDNPYSALYGDGERALYDAWEAGYHEGWQERQGGRDG